MMDDIQTLVFCDETKFHTNDGDIEDSIYYFGVSALKSQVRTVHNRLNAALKNNRVKTEVFHSSTLFREKRPRIELLNEIKDIIIEQNLKCFCFRYPRSVLFSASKSLNHHNNEIIDFNKVEFQALFYFLITLNTYLVDLHPNLLEKEIAMYFDRNVYGVKEIEAFNFPHENFILKRMTFSEKSQVSLLALPDFVGYVFRKVKQTLDKTSDQEISLLVKNCNECLVQIDSAGLFRYLEVNPAILAQALNLEI